MQINKEADFVLRGDKIVYPLVQTDELELYYDVKGKKNSDLHKDKLLDMSGNGRHGKLNNFSYRKLSGYTHDEGLVFDGIDDKLKRPYINGIDDMVKNLFDKESLSGGGLHLAGGFVGSDLKKDMSNESVRVSTEIDRLVPVKPNTTYTLSFEDSVHISYGQIGADGKKIVVADSWYSSSPVTFNTGSDTYYLAVAVRKPNSIHTITVNEAKSGNIQIEEDSKATPYAPHVPTPRMTYQMNNNIIAFDGDTVRWVKGGKVLERKGINILRNSNFSMGDKGWNLGSGFKLGLNKVIYSPNDNRFSHVSQSGTRVEGHKYYLSAVARNTKEPTMMRFTINSTEANYPVNYIELRYGGGGFHLYDGITEPDSTMTMPWGLKSQSLASDFSDGESPHIEITNLQIIDLTATFGVGNEPTLEEIQAEPDKWQWLPNPMDLLEAKELKGNILGDMEDIVDAPPRDRQSGKEVFTEHADNSHVEVEVDGQSYQHAGSGKNILHPDELKEHLERYGSGTSSIEDGMNIVEFREHLTYMKPLLQGKFKENTQYTITFTTKKVMGGTLVVRAQYTDGTSNILFTNNIMDSYRTQSGTTQPGKTIDFIYFSYGAPDRTRISLDDAQIEEGIAATSYEPPAPTPDYPIEIESVNGFDVVSNAGGRNLLKNTGLTDGTSGWSGASIYELNREDVFRVAGIMSENANIPLEPNQYYTTTMEIYPTVDIPIGYNMPLHTYFRSSAGTNRGIGTKTTPQQGSVAKANEWTRITEVVKTNQDVTTFKFHVYHPDYINSTSPAYIRNIKLEKGNISTDWTPAPEDITEDSNHPLIDKINLSLNEPLRSVGDVKDRIYKDSDGLWKVERNVGEVGLKETRGWSADGYEDGGYNYAYFRPVDFKAHGEVRSNILPQGAVYDNTRETVGKTVVITFNLRDSRTGVTSADNADDRVVKIRNYLISIEGAMVSYELATPTTETLDQELQDQLNTLKSFKGSNYVYTVQNTDNLHKEQLKPTLHATFNSKDYLKETRTLTNLLIWARELSDEELIHHNQLFLNRFNLPSDRVIGEPIEQTLNLLHGGVVGHSLEQNYTINI